MKAELINRNLEKQDIYLTRFWSGLVNNRSPLFIPLSQMGLQVVQRLDTLWGGLNTEISPAQTLTRRPGYLRYCSTAFAGGEVPLTFYSFRNLNGTVFPTVDTTQQVSLFGPTSSQPIFIKSTTEQSSLIGINNFTYGCDGTSAWKWNGTVNWLSISQGGFSSSPWGNRTMTIADNTITDPLGGTTASQFTGTANLALVTQTLPTSTPINTSITFSAYLRVPSGTHTIQISCYDSTGVDHITSCNLTTSWQRFSVTFSNPNSTSHALVAQIGGDSGFTSGLVVYAWGAQLESNTAASAYEQTELNSRPVSNIGIEAPVIAPTLSFGSGTLTSTNGGWSYVFCGRNSVTQTTSSASPPSAYTGTITNEEVVVAGDGISDPQCNVIDIYRTDDGGANYYFLATVNNVSSWSYTDNSPDSSLNDLQIAPVAGVNAPIPAGCSLLAWYAGRLWAASGNNLYFSAGPDCTNGVGEEAWPGDNVFAVPGAITALLATPLGLVVCTADNSYVVTGSTSISFTVPQLWQQNFGVQSQNCACQDSGNLYFFTSRSQLWVFSSGQMTELGSPIEASLGAFNPSSSYITVLRNGSDQGLFISDGSTTIYRMSLALTAWCPVAQPVNGVGAINSIEVTPGNWKLLTGRATGNGYILARDTSTFTDDSQAYTANVIIGSLTVAPPRQTAVVNAVCIDATNIGTYPTVGILLNDISTTGTFVTLPHPVPDPPMLTATSSSIWMRRHDLKAASTPLPQMARNCQVQISFGTDTVKNELLSMALV